MSGHKIPASSPIAAEDTAPDGTGGHVAAPVTASTVAAAADEGPGAAMLETGRLLFAKPWTFRLGAPSLGLLPPMEGHEIAFAGRSNVGKSSLINALVGQKALARTSNTPGRTQELNFFRVDEQAVLVDMPGYGYAQAPKDKVDAWTRLVFGYLRGRQNLKRVYLLIDSRHGPKANDLEVMGLLDKAAVSYQIVMTKSDKIGPKALAEAVAATTAAIARRPAAFPRLVITSSEKGLGIDVLRAEIALALAGG